MFPKFYVWTCNQCFLSFMFEPAADVPLVLCLNLKLMFPLSLELCPVIILCIFLLTKLFQGKVPVQMVISVHRQLGIVGYIIVCFALFLIQHLHNLIPLLQSCRILTLDKILPSNIVLSRKLLAELCNSCSRKLLCL